MKRALKVLCLVLAAVFLLGTFPVAASAANAPYTYKVRIFPGNNGTADSGDCLELMGIASGSRVTVEMPDSATVILNGQTITLDNSTKYFIKGLRVSGADALVPLSFIVDSDMDFVVAYGMRGNAVDYTVRFTERGTGRVLADPITYFGTVGEKPVVAHLHIDGYRPVGYNITGTLVDPAEGGSNDWTLEYVAVETGDENGGANQSASPAGPSGEAGGSGNAAGIASESAPESKPGTGSTPERIVVPELLASTEIIDMDDASLPLSPGGDAGEGRSFSLPEFFNGFTWAAAIPVGAKIGIAAGCVIVIAVFVWLFLGKKKKK